MSDYKKISSLEELKNEIESGQHDYFIQIGSSGRSSKMIDYDEDSGMFHVVNEIDFSEQDLDEAQMMDESCTNIGKAILSGSFWSYDYWFFWKGDGSLWVIPFFFVSVGSSGCLCDIIFQMK